MGYRGYWGYYESSTPIKVKGGIKAKSRKGKIGETWWSRRWIEVLESFRMGARLTRGRSYARKGQVISMSVRPGHVRARVQGSKRTPYAVEIELEPLTGNEWDKVTGAMASKAIFAAKLLAGEMPETIEEAFHEVELSLFPVSVDDLGADCSCPDWANPCKHVAAVYYLLAERFDQDPFLIFKLRGLTRERLMEALREKRASGPDAGVCPKPPGPGGPGDGEPLPLEECLEVFWTAGEELETFSVNFRQPEVGNAVLRILGKAPFSVGRKNVSAFLGTAYEVAGREALRKALEED